ncbi:MAG: hypothetical protein ACLSX0_01130 [Anaerostipes caccae]|jgi:hypothetical protein
MKKMKVRALAAALGIVMSTGMMTPANVQAAKKKLSVNRVYEQSTRIKGKTKGKYVVKVKAGKKTYKARASKKGQFSIKIPKVKAGKKYTVKVYKGKKYYTKKTIYVIAKKLRLNKFTANSKTISGYTRPSYKVKVTINKKTYTVKANKNSGYFKVKLNKKAGKGNAVVKIYNTKGKKTTSQTQKHSHVWKKQYKTIHHSEVGHYETVVVPAWDEKKECYHNVCLICGRDLTIDYVNSVRNKTYPILNQQAKDSWGYTEENGWPRDDYEKKILTEHDVAIDKEAPPFSLYMSRGGWDRNCDGHNYTSKRVYHTIHHDATTKKQWVIDKKAYDEKVVTGYKCDCGAKK